VLLLVLLLVLTLKLQTPAVHLVPSHWNFAEDEQVKVMAYWANCASIELSLNGKVLERGEAFTAGDIADFGNITWQNGTLEAKCKDKQHKVLASDKVRTAGEAAAITLTVDYNKDGLVGR